MNTDFQVYDNNMELSIDEMHAPMFMILAQGESCNKPDCTLDVDAECIAFCKTDKPYSEYYHKMMNLMQEIPQVQVIPPNLFKYYYSGPIYEYMVPPVSQDGKIQYFCLNSLDVLTPLIALDQSHGDTRILSQAHVAPHSKLFDRSKSGFMYIYRYLMSCETYIDKFYIRYTSVGHYKMFFIEYMFSKDIESQEYTEIYRSPVHNIAETLPLVTYLIRSTTDHDKTRYNRETTGQYQCKETSVFCY